MGFFLLGRDRAAGGLSLISTELFGTREDALQALSFLSANAGFEHAGSDVFVVDIDTATPVLLVTSSAPVQPVSVEVEAEPTPAEEPMPEIAAVETFESASVWEAPEVVPTVPEPPVSVESPIAEAVLGEVLEPAEETLSDALKRAAGELESQGIVAPESVGPEALEDAESVVAPGEEGSPEPAVWPWDIAAPVEAVSPEVESAAEPESPSPVPIEVEAPTDVETAFEPEVAAEVTVAPEVEVPAEVEAPTDVEVVEASPAYVPDPFEEPAVDDTELLGSTVDDEGLSLSRPVIMGAYDEAPPVAEPASVALPNPDELEGILADLGPVEEVAAVSEVIVEVLPGVTADDEPVADLGALTCDDCVYVNTCPNKEESDPSTCGSFQWKSV